MIQKPNAQLILTLCIRVINLDSAIKNRIKKTQPQNTRTTDLNIQVEKMTVNLYLSRNCMKIGHGSNSGIKGFRNLGIKGRKNLR